MRASTLPYVGCLSCCRKPRYDDGNSYSKDDKLAYLPNIEDATATRGLRPRRTHERLGGCHTTAQAPAGSPRECRGPRPAPTGRLSARSTSREGRKHPPPT